MANVPESPPRGETLGPPPIFTTLGASNSAGWRPDCPLLREMISQAAARLADSDSGGWEWASLVWSQGQ